MQGVIVFSQKNLKADKARVRQVSSTTRANVRGMKENKHLVCIMDLSSTKFSNRLEYEVKQEHNRMTMPFTYGTKTCYYS